MNSVLLVLHKLKVTEMVPYFNINLPINYDTGIVLTISDIIIITFSLIIGLWLVCLSIESFINGVRFFVSDNMVIKSHTIKLPGEAYADLLPNDGPKDLKPETPSPAEGKAQKPEKPIKPEAKPAVDKDIKPVQEAKPVPPEKPAEKQSDAPEIDKERFAKIIEQSLDNEDANKSSLIIPTDTESAPSLISEDASDKTTKILKDIANAQKEVEVEKKSKPKVEPPKTLNIISEDKEAKKEAKKTPVKSSRQSLEKIEDEFLRKPSLKTFFRFVLSSATTPRNEHVEAVKEEKPKTQPKRVEPDDIVHRNID